MKHQTPTTGEVLAVDPAERIISVIAVPYGQRAMVKDLDGAVWYEEFDASAFDGIALAPTDIKVNREHTRLETIGRVIAFEPNDYRGLLADLRISKTPRGDEALVLAADGCLGASIGFGVHSDGMIENRRTKTRRVVSGAWVDHVALTPSPAYSNAKVLSVRSSGTPRLDAARRDFAKLHHDSSRAARFARARQMSTRRRL